MSLQWIVSQIGSREHYAIPKAFEDAGNLELLITDYWCRHMRRAMAPGPASFRALAGRWHPGIPSQKVVSFNATALLNALRWRWEHTKGEAVSLAHLRIGKTFGEASTRTLEARDLDRDRNAFFGYCTGALEPIEFLRSKNILTIVGQIDPGRTEAEIVAAEREKWRDWETPTPIAEQYWQRLESEWAAASIVAVNSGWSRDALISQGVPREKIAVIPLAYEGPRLAAKPDRRSPTLSVLWLGTVCLRKGIQYLIEAARLLQGEDIAFMVAGAPQISPAAIATAPSNVTFLGRITRDRLTEIYSQADVFVLPTLSDGFGLTQIEAMAHGLPVIATPFCGEVVQHGQNGFIVAARDSDALASAILRVARDRQLLAEMSAQATRRAAEFSLKNHLSHLTSEIHRIV